MKYELISADSSNTDYIEKAKLYSIFEYASSLSKEEVDRINDYVKMSIFKYIKSYKLIIVNNNIVGCLLVLNKDDGVIIDEIYLDKEYRNNKIGSNIIKDIILRNDIVYLWVYKDNIKAIALYKRLGFKVIDETETRYYMCFKK